LGIGDFDISGALAVTPDRTTTYTVTAVGSGGSTTASATVTVANPISLQIAAPTDGAVVSAPSVSVTGTLTHAAGLETGLTVNGMLAVIDGDRFTVDHVPMVQGENTITATATDADGITLTDTVKVTADPPEAYIQLSADPVSGTSPFETSLHIDSTFTIASSQISYQGPGDVTFLDKTLDEFRVEISEIGTYTFRVEVSDQQGHRYTDDVTVQVVDEAALDALLVGRWDAMRQALIDGDIAKAATYFKSNRMADYADFFKLIPRDQISRLIPGPDKMELVEVLEGKVRYVTSIDIVVDGTASKAGTYIIFVQDDSGLWKISFF
jgi:hypothetical protein